MDYPLETARVLLAKQADLRPARSVVALSQANRFLEWACAEGHGRVNRENLELSYDLLDADNGGIPAHQSGKRSAKRKRV